MARSSHFSTVHAGHREELSKSRRKTEADPLGGDSRTETLIDGVALTLREFKRGKWKRPRNRV